MPDDEADVVARLFAREVPEVADGRVVLRGIARRPGSRCKVVVSSSDPSVDAVGACVGLRGCRIKNIVDALGDVRMDLVRWDDSPEVLVRYLLQPACIERVVLHPERHGATVVVREDQASLAAGRGGLNRELASRLSGWEIEIAVEPEGPAGPTR
jgi:N utilization substance protein A